MRTALRECWRRPTVQRRAGRETLHPPENKPAAINRRFAVSQRMPCGHADKPTMYYYCNRTTMSVSTSWPGAEGPQSCCGGGGDVELMNGNGGREITEARAISEWESATCDPADAIRSASTNSPVTREQEDGAARGFSSCCRRGAAPEGGAHPRGINTDGEDGGTRCPRCMAQRGGSDTEAREFQNSEATVSKRRGCSYSGASKRACFSGTITSAEDVVTHCGGSDPDSGTGSGGEAHVPDTTGSRPNREETFKHRRTGNFPKGAVRAGSLSVTCEMKGAGGVMNGEPRGCRTAKGRVRLCRPRSFLASTEELSANGTLAKCQLSDYCRVRAQEAQISIASSYPGARANQARSGTRSLVVNGRPCAGVAGAWMRQVEAAQMEARQRQVQLGERTDTLWRRLQAVQVKQVERHVRQQLGDLRTAAVSPNPAELSRLAHSCTEALRAAGGALDSDNTASSSGGGTDSEEEEGRRRVHRVLPSRVKSVCKSREWQWLRERAWLGSRWVWLQAQVSELEYGICALTEIYTQLRKEKVSQLRADPFVPETPLGAQRPSTSPQHCRLRKRVAEDSAHSPQTPLSPTSYAARVCPFLRQRRHRMIRLDSCPVLASKAMTLTCCCNPPAVCVLCGSPRPPAEEKYTWMCSKMLDQHFHPVLSMPSDFSPVVNCVTPLLSGLQSHSAVRCMRESTSCMGRRGQEQQKAGRGRRRLICARQPSALPQFFNTSDGSYCRSPRGVVSPGLLPQQGADLSNLPALPMPTGTPMQPLRRRRGESSFDIDNLVMPLGLAGLGARVQKLQYKEIITPSWRELDSVCGVSKKCVCSNDQCVKRSNTAQQQSGAEHKGEVEDLSDAVFLKRHVVWESRERSRWGSWARRRHRGRSSSSSYGDGKSCRVAEQAPCSPEPRQSKNSPCSPFCSAADDPFYQMDDEQQSVQPWERRSFPLLEEELQWLQDDKEPELEEDTCATSGRSQSTDSGISVGSLEFPPRTTQPHQLYSGGKNAVASTTQDSVSALPSLTPPFLSSLSLPSPHQNQSNHRFCPQTSYPA